MPLGNFRFIRLLPNTPHHTATENGRLNQHRATSCGFSVSVSASFLCWWYHSERTERHARAECQAEFVASVAAIHKIVLSLHDLPTRVVLFDKGEKPQWYKIFDAFVYGTPCVLEIMHILVLAVPALLSEHRVCPGHCSLCSEFAHIIRHSP